MALDNFLSAGGLLVERLRQALDIPAQNVRTAPSLEWAISNGLDNSVTVVFFDDQPDAGNNATAGRGKHQISNQFWLVLITSKNVADSGNAARLGAGALLLAVLKALQGHKLSVAHGELYRQRCPYRATDKNGFVHIPVLFSTRIVVSADL